MSEVKEITLYETTFSMFRDFQKALEDKARTLLPNIVPKVISILEHCKTNNINRDDAITPGYADLNIWYENVQDFDCLLMDNQNYCFLLLLNDKNTIFVYEIQGRFNSDEQKPVLEDFHTVVAPFLKKQKENWNNYFDTNVEEYIELIFSKDCSITPLVEVSNDQYTHDEVDYDFKIALFQAGFDYITNIKVINELETQTEQAFLFIEEKGE